MFIPLKFEFSHSNKESVPNIFTFCFQRDVWGFFSLFLQDFGEYQESYYSVQTTEGEQISQLIAGYIDIILKKV